MDGFHILFYKKTKNNKCIYKNSHITNIQQKWETEEPRPTLLCFLWMDFLTLSFSEYQQLKHHIHTVSKFL